jgi:hypothetical protein
MRGPEPCSSPAKHPYGRLALHGLLSATTDPDIIKSWWDLNAPEANLGVVTDRLVVVDLDPRHGGDESLVALDRLHGEWPHTWRSLTGGGGEHIIYAAPEGVEIASFAAEHMNDPPLGRGIDVRARGGYVVVPPSRHISGRPYCWSVDHHPADTQLAPAPNWLVEKLTASRPAGTPHEPVPAAEIERLASGVIAEYRDLAAARLAGYLFRHWVHPTVVIALMRSWTACHCVPALTDNELLAILNRIAGREADRREQTGAAR